MLLFVLHKLWSIIDDSGSVVSSVVSSHPALLSFPMLAGNVDRAWVRMICVMVNLEKSRWACKRIANIEASTLISKAVYKP